MHQLSPTKEIPEVKACIKCKRGILKDSNLCKHCKTHQHEVGDSEYFVSCTAKYRGCQEYVYRHGTTKKAVCSNCRKIKNRIRARNRYRLK